MYTSKNDTLCFSITNRNESDFGDICETNKRFINEQKFQNSKSSINDIFIMNEEEILRNIKKLNGFVIVPCNNNVASYILSLCEKQMLKHSSPSLIQETQEEKESNICNSEVFQDLFKNFDFDEDMVEYEEDSNLTVNNVKNIEINNNVMLENEISLDNNAMLENEMNLVNDDYDYNDAMFGWDLNEKESTMDVSEKNIDWLLSNNLKVDNSIDDDVMKLLNEINVDSMALELDFSLDSFELDYNLKLFDTLKEINTNDYDSSSYNSDSSLNVNESTIRDTSSEIEKSQKAKTTRKTIKNLDRKSKTIAKSATKKYATATATSTYTNVLSDHSYCQSKIYKNELNLEYAFNVTFVNMTENLKRRNLYFTKNRNRYTGILNSLSDSESDILTCWETLYDSNSDYEDKETYNFKDDDTEIKKLFAAHESDNLSKSILLLKTFLPYCGKTEKFTNVKRFINNEMTNNHSINRRMVSREGFWFDLKSTLSDTRSFLLIDKKYVIPLQNVDNSIYRNHKFQFETVRLFDRLIDFNSNVMYEKRRKISSNYGSFITIHLKKASINSLPEVLICPSRNEITIFSFIHIRRITISEKNIINILPLTTLLRIITKHWLSNYHNSALKITLHGRLIYK